MSLSNKLTGIDDHISEREYKMLRGLLRNKLTSNLKQLQNGVQKKRIRRTLVSGEKKNRRVIVNFPGWMLPVLYDEPELFDSTAVAAQVLNFKNHNSLFQYEYENEDTQNWKYYHMNYDMLWYWASQNAHVTEEVLRHRLEEIICSPECTQKKLPKEIIRMMEDYLDGAWTKEGSSVSSQRKRAKTLLEQTPHLSERFLNNLVISHNLFGLRIGEMILWEEEIRKQIENDEFNETFEWYLAYEKNVVSVHAEMPDKHFATSDELITSFLRMMGMSWKTRKASGTRFLEILLQQWDCLSEIWAKKKKKGQLPPGPFGWGVIQVTDTMLTEQIWKKMDDTFRYFVKKFCEENPECVSDMVKRKAYFPDNSSLRFLCCEVCHSPISVTIPYLMKRTWCVDSPFWDPEEEEKRRQEDIELFRWIRVRKTGKRISKLEMFLLQRAPEDLIRSAGKAGLLAENCMDLYIDFSRRFGNIELIPILLSMEEEA